MVSRSRHRKSATGRVLPTTDVGFAAAQLGRQLSGREIAYLTGAGRPRSSTVRRELSFDFSSAERPPSPPWSDRRSLRTAASATDRFEWVDRVAEPLLGSRSPACQGPAIPPSRHTRCPFPYERHLAIFDSNRGERQSHPIAPKRISRSHGRAKRTGT